MSGMGSESARLHRAGELTAVRVPTPAEEAVRDLVRARGDVLDDRKRMQRRLNAVLMRHGRIWRGGSEWTLTHRGWVVGQVFDEPALNRVVATYRGGLAAREAELRAIEAELATWAKAPPPTTLVAGTWTPSPSSASCPDSRVWLCTTATALG
ncbi:MAG: hypothetical protein JO364_03370 [Pseudonocardiales bacterium]|nr:hypothetical protein [Pseudonocardiales bacterium]MBV9029350.1 hypothetical protein [Pseudonocardiales bacterium]